MTRGPAREWIDRLTAVARENGGTGVRAEHGGKHIKLYVDIRGRTVMTTVPASPSDNTRGLMNAEADLLRVMGVRRKIVKSDRPRKRKASPRRQQAECPTLTVLPDPRDALAPLYLQLAAGWPGIEGIAARLHIRGEQAAVRIRSFAGVR